MEDAEEVLENNFTTAQAYCTKIEAFYQMCLFEQVSLYFPPWLKLKSIPNQAMVTATRGQIIFRNDLRFAEWNGRCRNVISAILHPDVFQQVNQISIFNLIKSKGFESWARIYSLDET